MINEYTNKPIGNVSLIFHKNGKFDSNTNNIVDGEIINILGDHNEILSGASKIIASRMANKKVYMDHIKIYYRDDEDSVEESIDSPLIVKFNNSLSDEPYAIDYDGFKCETLSGLIESINNIYLIKGVAFCATTDNLPTNCIITKLELCAIDEEKNEYINFSRKTDISAWSLPPDVLVTVLWKITF